MITEYEEIYNEICNRAERKGYGGDRIDLMMDIESAVMKFNMHPSALLNSDDITFGHDISGIINNILRDSFPASDFNHFVPRCIRLMSHDGTHSMITEYKEKKDE